MKRKFGFVNQNDGIRWNSEQKIVVQNELLLLSGRQGVQWQSFTTVAFRDESFFAIQLNSLMSIFLIHVIQKEASPTRQVVQCLQFTSPFKVHVTRTSEAPPQTNKHVG